MHSAERSNITGHTMYRTIVRRLTPANGTPAA